MGANKEAAVNKLLPLVFSLLLTPCASGAAVTTGGAVVISSALMAANNARAKLRTEMPDCAQCHEEIYPIKAPDTCIVSSGRDCWEIHKLGSDYEVMTREGPEINRIYRYPKWPATKYYRYLLPAGDGAKNPHYVLDN